MPFHGKQIKHFFGGDDGPASSDLYIPDPLGRVGQDHFIKRRDLPDPFGRLPEPAKPERFDLRNIFSLSLPVGMTGKNRRGDVAKVEGLMGAAGPLDLWQTDGPTGYYGARLEDAVKRFQKSKSLKVDGHLNPGGETIGSLHDHLSRKVAQLKEDQGKNPGGGNPESGSKVPPTIGTPPKQNDNDIPEWVRDIFNGITAASGTSRPLPSMEWPGPGGIRG